MHQTCDDHKQDTYGNNRCTAKTREGFLGVKHTRDIKHADGAEKHGVGAPLGEQQDAEHTQHRHNSNPCIKAKA